MDYKKTLASVSTETQDIRVLDAETKNIYESVVIIYKRANQVSQEIKQELNRKLEEFAYYTDNLEEVFENSALAMFNIIHNGKVKSEKKTKITVKGRDFESLLYNFLEEFLLLFDSENFFLSKIEDIKRVYSHPQGLSQCDKFLDNYPQWERVSYYDTAGSVAFVAKDGKKENAAIAGDEAAGVYKMQILKAGIETNSRNYTRFVIIAREELAGFDNPDKAALVFSTANKPGSLFLALKVLADGNINMKKLESRPIPGKPWEQMFYVDVDVPAEIEIFFQAVEQLKKEAKDFRVLGIYRV